MIAAAQETQQPAEAPKVRAIGLIHCGAIPVPGATVRLVHMESRQAWVTWTDENGKFDLPSMPAGKYSIEAVQLGFQPAKGEMEWTEKTAPEPALAMKILTELPKPVEASPQTEPPKTAAQQQEEPKSNPTPSAQAKTEANSTPVPPPNGTQDKSAKNNGAKGPQGQQAGKPGGAQQGQMTQQQMIDAMRQRMQQGGFRQVDANGAGGPAGGAVPESSGAGAGEGNPLGDAASADSMLLSGTVGRGATAGGDLGFLGLAAGMFGMGGGNQNFGFPGGGEGGGAFGGGQGGGAGVAQQVMVFMGGGPGGPGAPAPGQGGRGGQQGQRGQGQAQGQGQRGRGQGQGQNAQGDAKKASGQQAQSGPPNQSFQFGDGMGALMGMQRILKQQANRVRFGFHTTYDNSVWDARPYSLTEANPAKVANYRFSYGVNVGGPLVIPKIYNGKDKTFFFANYEGNHNRNPVDTFSTVPLPAERGGDFTARGIQLFDPFSNLTGPRTPIGSVLPPGLISSASTGLLQFIPLPNLPGTVQNFHLQARVPSDSDRFNIRILHTINQRLNFNANYNISSTRSKNVQNFPTLKSESSVLGQSLNLGLNQTYTPRLSNASTINWSRNRSNGLNAFAFVNDIAGNLGITGISTAPINFGVPMIGFTNFTDESDPVPALRRNQTLRAMDNITWARQKHTIRGGGELRRMQTNNVNDPTARGNFNFTGLMTSQLDAAGHPIPGTGFDFADFLLGLPQSTTVRFGSSHTYFRSWAFNGYAQDDWRVHPRFTVTAGIRYELATPPIELFNKLANLDMNDSITAVAVVLPGNASPFHGDVGRSLIKGDHNNWAPRLAIAWRPKIKRGTTVRAGYSIFYNSSVYGQLVAALANQPPWAQAQTRQTDAVNLLTLQNGFPPAPLGSVQNTIGVDPNYRVGYAQIWNTSVETQIVRDFNIEVTYTGTKGSHLDLLRSPNRAIIGGGPLGTDLQRRIPTAPGFTWDTFGASSIYHALQARLTKRFSKGWMLGGTYTFGKSIDNASSIGGGAQTVVQDDNNFRAERGLSTFDVRHRFNAFYIWELPFGERKRYARKGWEASLFGSWSVNGSATISTGTPYTARLLGSAANNSGTGNNFSERPDQISDANLSSGGRDPLHFFNTAAFVLPVSGTFGDASRGSIEGPGTILFNLSAGKNIRLGKEERHRLDLRWDVQNLLNTPNFTGLSTSVNSSTFGRVMGARQMRTMSLSMRVNF